MLKPESKACRDLARLLACTGPEELSCEEFLDRVAAFVEQASAGTGCEKLKAMVTEHTRLCGECREELDAMMTGLCEKYYAQKMAGEAAGH